MANEEYYKNTLLGVNPWESYKCFGAEDSAANKLYDALLDLTTSDSGAGSYLAMSVYAFKGVADVIRESNPSLGSSWDSICNLLESIDEKVTIILRDLIKAMMNYAQTTAENENKSQKVAEEVLSKSDDLLSRLNEI